MHQFTSDQGTITFDPVSYSVGWCADTGDLLPDPAWPANEQAVTPFIPDRELMKLTLLLTEDCNLNCRYCCGRAYRKRASMSVATATQAVNAFTELFPTLRSVVFFGGEPLLERETLYRLVAATEERVRNAGGTFAIITNGTLLNQGTVRFFSDHQFRVTISCDGPPVVNDLQRVTRHGHGTAHRIEQAMEWLLHAGLTLNVEVTFTRSHLECGIFVEDTLKYLASRGAHNIHLVPVCGTFDGLTLTDADLGKLRAEFRAASRYSITTLASDTPVVFKSAFYVLEALSLRRSLPLLCFAGAGVVSVHPDGNVYPCYLLYDRTLNMGNVNDPNFMSDFHAATLQFRQMKKEGFAQCAACWARTICFSCYGPRFMDEHALGPPRQAFCEVQRGTIEGAIEGLVALRRDTHQWTKALENITAIYSNRGSTK